MFYKSLYFLESSFFNRTQTCKSGLKGDKIIVFSSLFFEIRHIIWHILSSLNVK